MRLHKRNIFTIIISAIFILILIYSSNNFIRINYLIDSLKSFYYGITGEYNGSGDFRIVEVETCNYINPYKSLSQEFIHFGNMLFIHAVNGESINRIAKKAIKYTLFYKSYKLANAIMSYNGLDKDTIGSDMILYIPYSLPSILPDLKNHKKPDIVYTRGLYFNANSIGGEKFFNKIFHFREAGINAIVFDVKDVDGNISYLSHVPDVIEFDTHKKRTLDNIDRMIRILKQAGIYTIARIAVFRDHLLCSKKPDYAIHSKRTGKQWNPGSKELWCDPTNKYVQDYNIHLAIEMAEKGVDEIQFDYIRFPTKGDLNDAKFAFHYGTMSKEAVIEHFLKRAYKEISGRNTLLSIDIFGVTAWGKEEDIKKLGQRIEVLSRYCDVISPMLYPSHFNDDFDGFPNPGDEPYHFIYKGLIRTDSLANGKVIRPWLQAFGWRVTNYNEDYIIKQVIASREAGAYGYMFWNSSNSYDVVYRALRRLIAMNNEQHKEQ